jgi:phenylpyruvate tautomerase PptA (4-oxalocrotonate tautomerase family)
MPLVHITTSAKHPEQDVCNAMLKELSRTLAKHFDKPEKWAMTALAPRTEMTFGGSTAPACYVEVKNIGLLQPEKYQALSATLCAQIEKDLNVDRDRIYIEFTNAPGTLWGWNGTTLG